MSAGWLIRLLLSFYDSDDYDDVRTSKTRFSNPQVAFVAEDGGQIIGLIDGENTGIAATIDSIVVHPSGQRLGVASALLQHALARMPADVRTLDAWTLETVSANRWYQQADFRETSVICMFTLNSEDPGDGFETPPGLSPLQSAFLHSPIENEAECAAGTSASYVCRQYLMDI